ncbi:fatty-acyl-CoA synthase [Cupriavidus necator]|nr:fatty-acyl-CoA synthase [Cupriavidus necator]
MAAQGVAHGTTVAVMDWDSHRYLECYFGVPMMGATLFTVNVRLSAQQILYTLSDSGAEVVLLHPDFVPLMEEIRGELASVRRFILLADRQDVPATSLPFCGEYEALLRAALPDYDFPEFDENTRAATFYTTGTTGDPKGVGYRHRDIVLHALASATSLCAPRDGQRLHREDVYMPITPMFHVLAWGIPYVAVMLGLHIVLPGRYAPDLLLQLRETERVTFSHCVPTLLQMLLQAAQARGQDLSAWKLIVGGSALPPALCEAALACGMDVFAGYGMSETGPIVALAQLPPGHADGNARRKSVCGARRGARSPWWTSAWSTNPCTRCRATARRAARSCCAPFLTPAYHGKPAASAELWASGYLHTQDIAVMGTNGFVQIVDRIKDVIKTGGEWVSSIEVEG